MSRVFSIMVLIDTLLLIKRFEKILLCICYYHHLCIWYNWCVLEWWPRNLL